jgi:lysophospholipase L1-like esterase
VRLRLIIKRIAAASLGVVLALALTEITLRVFRLAPASGVVTVTAQRYTELPGILAPNQQLVDRRKRALPHRVTVDSLGYRGSDFPRRKATAEFRVLLAGDSFTYGDFVDDDQTLPAQLEGRLRARCSNVRVINAGLGGATIVDEAHLIERALPLSPDLVVVVFSENDVTDLAETPIWTRLAANRRAKSRLPLSLVYPILRRTALWNFGLHVVGTMRARGAPPQLHAAAAEHGAPSESDSTAELRERYRQAFLALRDTLHGRGIPFWFAAYPSHFTVSGSEMPEQVDWAVRMAQAAGVPAVNLLPPLRDSGLPPTKLYLLPADGHPSPLGYAVAAAYVGDRVLHTETVACKCR